MKEIRLSLLTPKTLNTTERETETERERDTHTHTHTHIYISLVVYHYTRELELNSFHPKSSFVNSYLYKYSGSETIDGGDWWTKNTMPFHRAILNRQWNIKKKLIISNKHTRTHAYIYIYIYISRHQQESPWLFSATLLYSLSVPAGP